jgi:hypothetical protein
MAKRLAAAVATIMLMSRTKAKGRRAVKGHKRVPLEVGNLNGERSYKVWPDYSSLNACKCDIHAGGEASIIRCQA